MKQNKVIRIDFRATESDRQALKKLAESEGQNLSKFLRSLPEKYPHKTKAA